MERRKAITTAAAASLTLLAGATGMMLNSDLVRGRGHDPVGQLNPVTATGTPSAVYVDPPAAAGATPALSPAPAIRATGAPAVTTSSASPAASQRGDDHSNGGERDHDERDGEYDD